MTIKKSGDKYKLMSKKGKVLGTHSSKTKAERQERAVQASKHRRGGWRSRHREHP